MKHHSYTATVRHIKEKSQIEIKSSVDAKEFGETITDTLAALKADVTLPGFRKGTAPEKMVRAQIGEGALLAEAAEQAIAHAYGHIIEEKKLDVIGRPEVTISKIAEGNPLEFTILTDVMPTIEKLDYKTVAKSESGNVVDAVTVTDEELKKEQEKVKELTKEELIKAKEYRAHEKKRLSLIDALVKEVDVVIPEALIEGELDRMMAQMKHDIERMNLSFADYLKHLKKTEADLRKEWTNDAAKRIKLDLAIAHIAEKEKIAPDAKKVEAEVEHAKEHHKGIDADRARSYFSQVFLNQAVFDFLEQK